MATGRSGYYYSMSASEMDRILLRFRPIAPKPAASGSASGGSSSSPENSGLCNIKPGIKKRRRRSKRGNDDSKKPASRRNRKRKPGCEEKIVYGSSDLGETPGPRSLKWLGFGNKDGAPPKESYFPEKPSMMPRVLSPVHRTSAVQNQATPRNSIVASTITVEWVADTWVASDALGRTDAERRSNLETDTCPGFTSDGWGRVTWANGAFRRMVGAAEDRSKLMVWLVAKEGAPETAAFACRVRMQYARSGEGRSYSLTLPCDVWRMDGGGFAWRLDVDAALTLGLGL
ncbi:uncharacterized protein LOC115749469 [Rhodamnia argentea]|uniref:Uncharacterized protein LOC115749469 n=1 Tax=Rhodamnia argentea TaxID=178133 RepID=A0A8B8Q4X4_9MYRT|nr:uncharacterized protein LOC115749469 [Rhodamnia argentea]XP_048138739.1 uncharacterized protein LOC115749469 [Rhodamnia argentea]